MNVAIAGAHGQIALRLTRLLVADGNTVIGLIRNPDHSTDVRQAGASPVVCDLERSRVEELAQAIAGADAVVFAAGAGRVAAPSVSSRWTVTARSSFSKRRSSRG